MPKVPSNTLCELNSQGGYLTPLGHGLARAFYMAKLLPCRSQYNGHHMSIQLVVETANMDSEVLKRLEGLKLEG